MAPVLAVDTTIFAGVVLAVVAIGVIVAVVAGALARDAYDHIGGGGLGSEPGDRDEQRDEEIGQMLGARDERRARRALDREPIRPRPHEAAPALSGPAADPGLAEELLQLALARNARRRRQGLEPLDAEAEVERRLRELRGEGEGGGGGGGGEG